jgi:hypothetical protein
MKYTANPVEVDAFKIVKVEDGTRYDVAYTLELENGRIVQATSEMTSRMTPQIGDYWVVQGDGYIYLNPKAVFERKYSPSFDLVALQRLRKQSA